MWYVTKLDICGKKNSGAGWAGSRVLRGHWVSGEQVDHSLKQDSQG